MEGRLLYFVCLHQAGVSNFKFEQSPSGKYSSDETIGRVTRLSDSRYLWTKHQKTKLIQSTQENSRF